MLRLGLSLLLATLFLSGCSHMRSGHYIVLDNEDSVLKLSKEFNIPTWELEDANRGKKFSSGEWIFVPIKRGLVDEIADRSPSSYTAFADSGDFIWPVPASKKISSPFGKRWGRPHNGIDIVARRGAHILSTSDGVVIYSGNDYNGFGNMIIVAHRWGLFSIYAHNQKNFVKKNQKVYKGQVIAKLGNTGRSTGPHLHFEVRRNGRPIDPVTILSKPIKGVYAKN